MRDNCVFSGILEDANIDCESAVRQFMTGQLKMAPEIPESIMFSRIHRMGKVSEGRPRAIVARFEHFKQKKTLLKARAGN